jgi:hypothetical protein
MVVALSECVRDPSLISMLSLNPILIPVDIAATPLDSIVISRMSRFAGMSRYRRATVLFAAQHLSSEEIRGLGELFASIDTNGGLEGWGRLLFPFFFKFF